MRSLPLVLAAVVLALPHRALGAQCTAAVGKIADDGRIDAARIEVERALKANPRDDAALNCMGMLSERQGKASDAADWFEKAVAANDKRAIHHYWFGKAKSEDAATANP